MPRVCTKIPLPGGGVAIVTTSTHVNPNDPCGYCGTRHAVLCDMPIHKGKDAKRYTCSRRLCARCAMKIGENLDFCPPHAVLIEDYGLAAQLDRLLREGTTHSHKVALDLVDQVSLELPAAFRPKNGLDWFEYFTERAAMFEYEAGYSRPAAERRALALAGEAPKSVDWRRSLPIHR